MKPVFFEFHGAQAAPAPEKDVVIIQGVLLGATTTFRMSRADALAMAGRIEQACQSEGNDEQRSTAVLRESQTQHAGWGD